MTSDFKLTYYHKCPFKIGDEIESGVTDDSGSSALFLGRGYVSSIIEFMDDVLSVEDSIYSVTISHRFEPNE